MNEEEFRRILWRIVKDVSGEDIPAETGLDVNFREIDVDSLSLAEMIGVVEDEIGVRLDDRIMKVTTPRALLELINSPETKRV